MLKYEPRQELLYSDYENKVEFAGSSNHINKYNGNSNIERNKIYWCISTPNSEIMVNRYIYLQNTVDVKLKTFEKHYDNDELKRLYELKDFPLSRPCYSLNISINGCHIHHGLSNVLDTIISTNSDLQFWDKRETYTLLDEDTLRVKWIEPVISPNFLFNTMKESYKHKSLIGVSMLEFTYLFKTTNNVFQNFKMYDEDISLVNSVLNFETITQSLIQNRPKHNIEQKYDVSQKHYYSKYFGASSKELTSDNIQLHRIPKYIYIYAKNNDKQIVKINKILICFNNRCGLFCEYDVNDLYDISSNILKNTSFDYFNSKTMICLDAEKYLNGSTIIDENDVTTFFSTHFNVKCYLDEEFNGDLITIFDYNSTLVINDHYTQLK